MPMIEAFLLAEEAAAAATAAEAATAAATATEAATAATAAEAAGAGLGINAGLGAGATGTAATGAQQAAALTEAASAVGGQGAGSAGIQQAMQTGMDQAVNTAGQGAGGVQVGGPMATPNVTGTPLEPMGDTAAKARGITGVPQSTVQGAASPYSLTGSSTAPGASSMQYQLPTPSATQQGLSAGSTQGLSPSAGANSLYQSPVQSPPSAFERGFDKFSAFADKHPFMTGAGAYLGAYKLGLLDPKQADFGGGYSGPLTGYKMSSNFQGRHANPEDYQPTLRQFAGGGITDAAPVERMSDQNAMGANTGYPQADIQRGAYATPWQTPVPRNVVSDAGDANVDQMSGQERLAHGGIIGFAKGGDLTKALDFYRSMTESKSSAPAGRGSDVGIYYDMDPDTRYQDPLTAAQIRQAKVNKRANMQLPTGKRPTPMGALNLRPPGAQAEQSQSSLDPENAAKGGIMQARDSSLGGYAAGGNPRLLNGPGDGMSDNIPAMIGSKQPARLADGEFVIPADVVSHLGNGSTKAGAQQLHKMMDNVRKARTGNPKQGKQINPKKYMPK